MLIEPGRPLGYSDIFIDFLAEKGQARDFYRARNLASVATSLDNRDFDHQTLASILERQNRAFNASDETLKNIGRIKEPKAVCVFSGQQACLFGGPLLVLIKAMGIVKAAALYEKELGRPVIPIFWIAGDDHDFEEANHTFVLDRQSQVVRIDYNAPPQLELPTSETELSNASELHNTKELLKETLGQTDFTGDLYNLIEHAYTTDDTLVSAFGKLMALLTGKFGLVLFNPCDDEAKRLAIPFFERLINEQDSLQEKIVTTNANIADRGYHIQVEKKENAAFLFYNREGRQPLLRDGENFTVGDCSYSRDELLKCLYEHPGRFSPDVMTRPLFQSYLFPVISQKGGPAEIAYLAQINPLFELFDLVPPLHVARPSATIIEARHEKLLEEYNISFEELTGDVEQLINRIMAESFPPGLEEKFESVRKNVRTTIEQFAKDSLKFDPSLEKFAEQIIGKIDYNLNAFEGKIFSSHKKKSSDTRERIYRLWHSLYTNRGLQERALNVSYFLSRYGRDFLDFLFGKLDSEQRSHQLIYLSEMNVK